MLSLKFGVIFTGFLASLIISRVFVNTLLKRFLRFEEDILPQLSWGFLAYFLIFILARCLAIPVNLVTSTYEILAIASLIFLIFYWSRKFFISEREWLISRIYRLGKIACPYLIFFVIAAGLGTYLEFPSDPTHHLQGIQGWEQALYMDFGLGSKEYDRFIYFFQHWLLRYSNLNIGVRIGLNLLGAMLQTMLFWQSVRITKLLTNNVFLVWLGGLMSLGYFGYDAFSFYRYTTIGGATIAHICCLEGFILIISVFLKEEIKYFFLLPPILLFCYGNHEQETLLQLNAIVGISCLMLVFRRNNFTQKMLKIMMLIVVLASVLTAYILLAKEPLDINLTNIMNGDFNLTILFEVNDRPIIIHDFGMLNIMTGFLGWCSALLAIMLLISKTSCRKLDIMAAITVWPWIVLLNPIGIELLERYMHSGVFHRLIYGSLYWLFPIVALPHLWSLFIKTRSLNYVFQSKISLVSASSRNLVSYFLISLLVVLSFIPNLPIQGKMAHFFLKPEPYLDGRNLQAPIQYLRQNTPNKCLDARLDSAALPIRSWVLSDPYTNTYLAGTGYFHTGSNRFGSPGFESDEIPLSTTVTQQEMSYSDFLARVRKYNICYVFIHLTQQEVKSKTAQWVEHWPVDYADTKNYYSSDFINWVSNNPQDFELEYENKESKLFKVL
ncbi:MAG: hypothetical protein AAF827_05675 [Cyanobacteria bacterium P01_D01_bin.6]